LRARTVVDLDKLWKAKREAGYSANSIRIMRTALRKALGQAEREGIVLRNVAALSSAPRIRATEGWTLVVEQARQLLETVTDHRFDVAIMIALAYGLRRSEVLGLHWSTVDWDAGTVRVTHGVKRTFSKLSKKAGLGHWHPHELRHSGASLMLAQGTPLHVVSEILGHASITITKDVYGHLLEGDRRAAATSIDLRDNPPPSVRVLSRWLPAWLPRPRQRPIP
jgi:integrase